MLSLEVAQLISADLEIVSTGTDLSVVEVDFREDPRWESFVSSHPDALIYHHAGWLSALESEYSQKCISLACVDETGRLCAVLPLFWTKGLRMNFGPLSAARRLCSLPRTPIAGPLATSQRAATAIVQYAVELARSQPGVQLEIKTKVADLDKSVSDLTCQPWRPTYVAELPARAEGAAWEDFWETLRTPRNCVSCKDCRQLRFGNARRQHRVNWSVNKAIKLAGISKAQLAAVFTRNTVPRSSQESPESSHAAPAPGVRPRRSGPPGLASQVANGLVQIRDLRLDLQLHAGLGSSQFEECVLDNCRRGPLACSQRTGDWRAGQRAKASSSRGPKFIRRPFVRRVEEPHTIDPSRPHGPD